MLPTELPRLVFGFQKYVDGTGRSTVPIQVQISCGRMIKIINMIFFSIKQTCNLFLIDFKQHSNRKCLPFIEISNQNVQKLYSLRSCAQFAPVYMDFFGG